MNKIREKSLEPGESSPFGKSKYSLPQVNTKEKFYSTRSTSSSSMFPFITQTSIHSSNSQLVKSPDNLS